MCCSSTAAKSPMAQYLKSQTPEDLWKAALKPRDPLKPDAAGEAGQSSLAAKSPGTGLVLDVTV
jgi:hypothetical protein